MKQQSSSAVKSTNPYDEMAVNLMKEAGLKQPVDGMIRLSGPLEHDNIVNGDGLRAVVWTQGCPNHCKGCQNPETWDFEAGFLVKITEIEERLREFPGQAGLTFCGGEPFVQPKACKEIADLYIGFRCTSQILNYSASHTNNKGREFMFYNDNITIPADVEIINPQNAIVNI